ncbi:uncharacterized protein LOC126893377 [Diabrotica virgifera virgifera]|uniref:Uncharacterized protein n=1 Tax=Diabrotica virgifera virgifera TaxID=50390 RepID=A0ABM5LAI4_DIAVI|nr:uncharacterized protein LOC126893377 [Diabrotica virgifera virgifera]
MSQNEGEMHGKKKSKAFRHSTSFYRQKAKLLKMAHTEPEELITQNGTKDFHELPDVHTQASTSRLTLTDDEIKQEDVILTSANTNRPDTTPKGHECDLIANEFELTDDDDEVTNLEFEIESKYLRREKLRHWAVKNGIAHTHLNELLDILLSFGISGLPKDARTLVATPKLITTTKMSNGGEFWYNGIEKCLKNIELPNHIKEIKLNTHVDGIPIGKSSKQQFWPILMNISNIPELSCKPFVVAIFCGKAKPENAELFLQQFPEELNRLLIVGIYNNQNQHMALKTNAFICDTPARAFIRCTVSHNAYYSCLKCSVKGWYDKKGRHISFPQTNCNLRTDASFRSKSDPEHHQKDKNQDKHNDALIPSPLERLPIDMVRDFVVADSLHLIDLGLVKRCLSGWVHGSYNFKEKLFSPQITSINS